VYDQQDRVVAVLTADLQPLLNTADRDEPPFGDGAGTAHHRTVAVDVLAVPAQAGPPGGQEQEKEDGGEDERGDEHG
jgi:hypothetical protein